MKHKIFFLLLSFIFIIFSVPSFAQTGFFLDHVDGVVDGQIQPGVPINFYLRLSNHSGTNAGCITNGFEIYLSNNGVMTDGQFQSVQHAEPIMDWTTRFSLGAFINSFVDGIGADTVGMSGVSLTPNDPASGFEDGFDEIVLILSTQVSADYAGDSLCIDSCFYQPSGSWLWVMGNQPGYTVPDWSGPHCFEILPSCCVGIRGNINNSSDDQLDISDLDYLIQYMFVGGEAPLCFDEADVNDDGELHVADLVYLVAYMFQGGPPPVSCL